MVEVKKATCMLCEATCGLEVSFEGQRVVKVRGDDADTFSRGYICPKATAIGDIMADPDRVVAPQRRSGDQWSALDWDTALSEAAAKIAEIQKKYGRSSVGIYFGNPTVHSLGALAAIPFFGKAIGTRARFSATSVDQLPHMLAGLKMFGHQLLLPVPDLDRTHYFLVLGANPLASNGSLMTVPDVKTRLEDLKRRGGRLVVLDPRRTETALMADQHHFIRPGADAAFLLGVLHTLFAEKISKPGRLTTFLSGLEQLSELVQPFTPERVAPSTGLSPQLIREIARELADAPSAAVYGRMGASAQTFGGLTAWLLYAVNIVTGNLDRPGGVMFTQPAADFVALAAQTGDKGHFDIWRSRVRRLPEFGGELPATTLAEEIETPGEGQIKALITFAGNPVLSVPNGPRLERALSQLEVMVSIDIYRNETTRHAHYLLPTAFGFERDHYDLAFYLLAVRNFARFSPGLVPPPPGVKTDFDILMSLAQKVYQAGGGRRDRGLQLLLKGLSVLGPRRVLDGLLRAGPNGLGRGGLSVAKLLKNPSGIDLGPLEPCLPQRLYTSDHKIDLVPKLYLADLARLEKSLAETPPPLVMIGRRALRNNNSWLHNSHRLVKGPLACTLLIHPQDAAAQGLKDGGLARLESASGAQEVTVEISDTMLPGVVSLPHGWGHHRPHTQLTIAQAHAGVSANDLTDDAQVDPLSGNAILNGIPVRILGPAAPL